MVLLEVAMYIKDIQEEECETAIKVNFIDPQNGKAAEGDDPSNIKQHETILTACWKYPEEQHQSLSSLNVQVFMDAGASCRRKFACTRSAADM